jgi:hypothetical protein
VKADPAIGLGSLLVLHAQDARRDLMPNDFFYAAYSYLDEWMSKDQRFHGNLAYENRAEVAEADGRKTLVDVATYYRVIRSFKVTSEPFRLQAAYEALSRIAPPSHANVVETICKFAEDLAKTYGVVPLSAASKFLWMRFRSPIVIYDSLVCDYLQKKKCGFNYEGYPTYYPAWLNEFHKNHERIQEACQELRSIKKFTLASGIEDTKLSEWTASEWFMERVFDHSMQ